MSADAIAAARAVLPTWAVWFPVASILLGGLSCAVLAIVGVAMTYWRLRALPPDAHWTERARLVWPVRRAIVLAWLLATVTCAVLPAGGPLSRPGLLGRWMTAFLVILAAAFAVGFAFENRWVRRLPLLARWRSAAGYVLLGFPAYWIAGALALWSAEVRLSAGWALAAGGLAVVLAVAATPWIGVPLRLVRRPPPWLEALLREAEERVGGPPSRLLVLPIAAANAFAFQLTRTIGVTQGALERLDDVELGAVLAHEVGHLREPWAVVLLRTAVAAILPLSLVMLPLVLRIESEWGWLALWGFVVAVLLAYLRLARALERRADAVGAEASPAYAAALEKTYAANLAPAVLRRAGAHPHLHDRMVAAGVTPAWPRPLPPPSLVPALVVLAAVAGALYWCGSQLHSIATGYDPEERATLLARVATDGRPSDVGQLAYWHLAHAEPEVALVLFRAAEAMDDGDAAWPASIAMVLSIQGRCAEAVEAARRSRSRDPDSPQTQAARVVVEHCTSPGQ